MDFAVQPSLARRVDELLRLWRRRLLLLRLLLGLKHLFASNGLSNGDVMQSHQVPLVLLPEHSQTDVRVIVA